MILHRVGNGDLLVRFRNALGSMKTQYSYRSSSQLRQTKIIEIRQPFRHFQSAATLSTSASPPSKLTCLSMGTRRAIERKGLQKHPQIEAEHHPKCSMQYRNMKRPNYTKSWPCSVIYCGLRPHLWRGFDHVPSGDNASRNKPKKLHVITRHTHKVWKDVAPRS